MTASLLVFVPIALLALVASFCFVGCIKLDSEGIDSGQPPPAIKYGDNDVINSGLGCVAYWPLWDPMGSATAEERVAGRNGEYRDKTSHPTQFEIPAHEFAPTVHSAQAFGDLTIGAAASGIVPGETLIDLANTPAPAIQVDGGYVFVDVADSSQINPSPTFSVEAWARPEWTGAGATRTLISSYEPAGANAGFIIWATDADIWQAVVGIGMGNVLTVNGPPVVKDNATYIVLTFDGTTARLFVNVAEEPNSAQTVPAGSNYAPNTTQPLTIGVGQTQFAVRNTGSPAAEPLFPTMPFNGTIQCVAIYSGVLDEEAIQKHFQHGRARAG